MSDYAQTLERQIAEYREVLSEMGDGDPARMAEVEEKLAGDLKALGSWTRQLVPLEQATLHYRNVLNYRIRHPEDLVAWSATQWRLGDALKEQGDISSRAEPYQEAIAAYRAAQQFRTVEESVGHWCDLERKIAWCLYHIGIHERSDEKLRASVASYRAVLGRVRRDADDYGWTEVQGHLGTALSQLAHKTGERQYFEEAAVAYREALNETIQKKRPLQWARTQQELGGTLEILDQNVKDSSILEQALEAYRAALSAGKIDASFKQDWLKLNIANVMFGIGCKRNEIDGMVGAVREYRELLASVKDGDDAYLTANVQCRLATAIMELTDREVATTNICDAVDAYEAAILVFARDKYPLEWAVAKSNLAIALRSLGKRDNNIRYFDLAASTHREILEVWTRSSDPIGFADQQMALGETLLACAGGNAERSRAAASAFREALKVWTRKVAPLHWAKASAKLADALLELDRCNNSQELGMEALGLYREALSGLVDRVEWSAWSEETTAVRSRVV